MTASPGALKLISLVAVDLPEIWSLTSHTGVIAPGAHAFIGPGRGGGGIGPPILGPPATDQAWACGAGLMSRS